MFRDPVCNVMVDEKKTKYVSEVRGKMAYFCSEICKSEFDSNPVKYGYYLPVDFQAMAVSKSDPDTVIGFDRERRGLFKTTDAGKTWNVFDYPGQHVTSLAISPSDPNVIFAGTDDGLYQSNNGADSWTQLSQYKGISVLALAFDVEGTLYASTEEFGLAKSSNLGKTWESINGPPDNLTATTIAVDLQNKVLYIAGDTAPQGYHGIFSGNLDGSDWQLIGTNKEL